MKDSLGKMVRDQLLREYELEQQDIGSDAHMKRKGFVFDTEVYIIKGVGHMCIMKMSAMLGLMKMETVVLSSFDRDMPLYNLDRVTALGRETQIMELYDTQLNPYPKNKLDEFRYITDLDAELEDYVSPGEHWYDAILYPCSYHKTGKKSKVSSHLSKAAEDYTATFIRKLGEAAPCNSKLKREKVKEFADNLVSSGGPAVDQVTRLFGTETAARLIKKHMYGV